MKHLYRVAGRRARGVAARVALAMTAAFLLPGAAAAQTWAEVGDAGDLPGTVQTTIGVGALNTITGTLSSTDDADLYCLEVLNPAAFSASLLCAAQADPSLWLFRSTGLGIGHNDLCQFGDKDLPLGFVSGAGTYYLAVAAQGRQAQSSGSDMWLTGLFTGPRAPAGPGAAGSLNGWAGVGQSSPFMNYTVNLQGASYCGTAVPTTGTAWGAIKSIYR